MWGKQIVGVVRAVLGARATRVALAIGVLWFPVWHLAGPQGDGAARAADPADGAPKPIVPLNSVPVPKPKNLGQFVKDQSAGIKLGKALFWDMQVGSDGVTSCASCHFAAGADNRSKNQINPRVGAFDTHKPNYRLKPDDFPFHKLADINDRNSTVLSDTNEVAGSAGVLPSTFNSIVPGTATENVTPTGTDPIFNVGGVNVRRATGRNAPSVINAVFNFRNFWDGRAQNDFNGIDPFGMRDTNAKVAQVVNGQGGLVSLAADCALVNGIPQVRGPLCLNNSSLASQAVGPVPNSVEMSSDGRTIPDVGKKFTKFRDIGRKLRGLRPLARQFVSPSDSVLGGLARDKGKKTGLGVSYESLIKAAFQPRWWDSKMIVRVDPSTGPAIVPAPKRGLAANEYPMTDYNFSLFFGLAVQMYESTLVSGQAPIDKFAAGDTSALTPQQQEGLGLFQGKAGCANCHGGPEFTNASVQNVVDQPLETMTMGDGNTATYDNGFYNIGVRPTPSDFGVGGLDPFGNPLSMTRLTGTSGRIAVDGSFKAPDLRNVALTPPYFHNGGQLTLNQVVDFYNRGGDFHDANIDNLDPDIETLGLTDAEKSSLVAFLGSLTDDRVRKQSAPFDHPELFVPDGHPGDTNSVGTDATGAARDDFMRVPQTGAGGGTPLAPFPTPAKTVSAPAADKEPVATAVPSTVDAGGVVVGGTLDLPVTVNNVGAANLQITTIGIEGANAADFTVLKSKCGGAAVKPNASCAITVRFKPSATGPRTAQLVLSDNEVAGPLRIDLAGTGA